MCNTNIRCAVLHKNGICPDKRECNCKLSRPTNIPTSKCDDENAGLLEAAYRHGGEEASTGGTAKISNETAQGFIDKAAGHTPTTDSKNSSGKCEIDYCQVCNIQYCVHHCPGNHMHYD